MAFSHSPSTLVNKFQRLCYEYLKNQERERLASTLRRFERSRDVVELIETMTSILDTPEKRAAFYPVVYELIPASCRMSYQEMLHRKVPPEKDIQSSKVMHRSFSSLQSDDSSVLTNSLESSNTINIQKMIHIQQSTKDGANLGFRLCYCDISGPGFFINSMEPEFAEWSGFEIGDELVAVNDISVHNWQMNAAQMLTVVAIQSQQRAGVDIQIQRLMFSPQKLTTDAPCILQDVCWYDIGNTSFSRKHTPKWPSQLRHTRMKMHDSTTGRMGLNIRGGREFECGIYISKIERDGLAERCGLRVGDQILTVNGINLVDIPYREACRQMAYEDTLDFVVRYTGQFPIYIDTPENRPSSTSPKEKRNVKEMAGRRSRCGPCLYSAENWSCDVGRHSLSDTSLCRATSRNYPYSNGRIDPIGSCSPGTIHSYKISDPTDEVGLFKKGLYSDGTSYILNPLCSDDSSLLSSLPNSPSSEPTSANDMECRRGFECKQAITDEPPKPPPRTGKPNLEKLNQILSKKNNATPNPHQSSRVSREDVRSQFSKIEIETTAIVHHPANDSPKHERLKDGDSVGPNSQGKFKSKPPRKHKKSKGTNNTYDDEKSKPESKSGKDETTQPELHIPQGLITTEPVDVTRLKYEAQTEPLEPPLIAKLESPVQTAHINIPDITIELANATKSEKIIELEHNGLEPCVEIEPINNPVNFIRPEVTVEAELLSVHRANSPTHDDDDDDRLSYISSVSMDYDGENFTLKWPLSEDEAMCSNGINSNVNNEEREKTRQLTSIISNFDDDDNRLTGNTTDSATEPVSLPLEKLSAVSEVVDPPVTTSPVTMTASSLPTPMPSAQNATESGNYPRAKRRTEDGRFANSVVRTMNNTLTAREEDSENNPFQMLKKMANVILTKEEMRNVLQCITEYKERHGVERMVGRLVDILDNPEKLLLLNQIRELVSPFDRGRFDSMLSIHENKNFQRFDYRDIFSEKGERGMRSGLKEDQSILARVQCRRKQLDAQMELLETLKKTKPQIYRHKEEDLNLVTVYVSKQIRTLGISVTGGSDCKRQQAVIIEEVHPGGAAAETKRIKPGMSLVSVDDEDIEAASHRAAVYTIRRAFTDRKKPYMKLVLRKQVEAERWPTS